MKQNVNSNSKIIEYLEKNLSAKRYEHSIRVKDTALKLGQIYRLDENKIELAALLHDVTKEKKLTWQLKMLRKYQVEDEQLLTTFAIMHAFTGSRFIQSEFGINDQQIIDAIEYHTIGHPQMDDIAKVIYIADYIEPERKQDNVAQIRSQVGIASLNQIMQSIIENEFAYFKQSDKKPHPNTLELYEKVKQETTKWGNP